MSALASGRTRLRAAPTPSQQRKSSESCKSLTSVNDNDRIRSSIDQRSDFLDDVRLEGRIIGRKNSLEWNLQVERWRFQECDISWNTNIAVRSVSNFLCVSRIGVSLTLAVSSEALLWHE